jgi:hypothetical protein
MQQRPRETLPGIIEELNAVVHSWPELVDNVTTSSQVDSLQNVIRNISSNLCREIGMQS